MLRHGRASKAATIKSAHDFDSGLLNPGTRQIASKEAALLPWPARKRPERMPGNGCRVHRGAVRHDMQRRVAGTQALDDDVPVVGWIGFIRLRAGGGEDERCGYEHCRENFFHDAPASRKFVSEG